MLEKFLGAICALYRCLCRKQQDPAEAHVGSPSLEATIGDIERLDPEDPLLGAIALLNPYDNIAGAAAERVKPRRLLRMIARTPEAAKEARIIAIGKLQSEEELFIELATRDDDTHVAQFAAHHVRSDVGISRLMRSKYETVRLVAVMQIKNTDMLRKIVYEDPSPELRERAQLRLRELFDGWRES